MVYIVILDFIFISFFILLSVYVILYSYLRWSWINIKHSPDVLEKRKSEIVLSLVIPFRNEEKHLNRLLEAITAQELKNSVMMGEIILVDDHSRDNGASIVKSHMGKAGLNIKLIHLPEHIQGKKQALTYGIQAATGTVIITTDCDCTIGKHWIQSIGECFLDTRVELLVSPVVMTSHSGVISSISAFEFHAFQIITAFLTHTRILPLANGANLAFSKRIFNEVGGYDGNVDIPSGDDLFLTHKVFRKFSSGIFYNKNELSVVETKGESSLSAIINQKIRWAGKWASLKMPMISWMAIFTFLMHANMLIIVCCWPFITDITLFLGFALGWFIKIYVDFNLLRTYHFSSKPENQILRFLVAGILYPIYVVIIGLASFFNKYQWKDRNYT